jgi:uncharacterized protein (DUF1499 family)
MTVQRVDVIYIDFNFHSVPDVGFSDFAVNRQRVEALGTRLTALSGVPS